MTANDDECYGDVSPIDLEQLDSAGCKSGIPRPYPFGGAAARLSDNLCTLLTTILILRVAEEESSRNPILQRFSGSPPIATF
jgi:hypothetical protein